MTVAVMAAFGDTFEGGFEVEVVEELKGLGADGRGTNGRRWKVCDTTTGMYYVAMADELRVFARPPATREEVGVL